MGEIEACNACRRKLTPNRTATPAPARTSGAARRCAAQPEGHRSVVHQAHLHVGTETPDAHLGNQRAAMRNEAVEQALARLRRGCERKARPRPLARIGSERELGNG